jgi:branched-chain amino acid aminotransferase
VFANTAGRLCEGTGTNVFVEHQGRLVTPPSTSGCLAGVTRALFLEHGDAAEADLALDALAGAGEALLTSSTRELQPIASVDGRALAACPGPLTEKATAAFRRLVASDLDP